MSTFDTIGGKVKTNDRRIFNFSLINRKNNKEPFKCHKEYLPTYTYC